MRSEASAFATSSNIFSIPLIHRDVCWWPSVDAEKSRAETKSTSLRTWKFMVLLAVVSERKWEIVSLK